MLEKLTVKNFALIDDAQISFSEGLNVMSGETGSGKSVIIEALNFVLGAKPERSLIRNGADECFVCAEFGVENNSAVKEIFNELEFDEEDVLIISRRFSTKNVRKNKRQSGNHWNAEKIYDKACRRSRSE